MLGPVIIVNYNPHWPDVFDELRAPVVAALGDLVVSVEHVGSTSVPGLAAKPIIDMDVVVPTVADVPQGNWTSGTSRLRSSRRPRDSRAGSLHVAAW